MQHVDDRKITSGYPLINSIKNCQTFTKFTFLSLILSGDIALNPGPVKYPCGSCEKPVKSNQHGILCDGCEFWYHRKCTTLNINEYTALGNSDDPWLCSI